MMRKFLVTLLSFFLLFTCFGLISCGGGDGEGGSGGSGNAEQGEYVVKYYFENADGDFVHDERKDETGTKELGKSLSDKGYAKTFEGYVLFKEHPNYRGFDIVSAEATAHLDLYYKLSGSGVPETPDVPDTPTVSGSLCVQNSNYVKPTGQEVKATLTVSDPNALQGVVTLYNTEETVNSYGAKESYYLFATQGNKAVLNIYWGGEFLEVKSADITAPTAGNHEYKIVVNSDGSIVCSFDSNVVLNVAVSDFSSKGYGTLNTAGRVGTYGDGSVSAAVVVGDMSLAEMKEHFKATLGKISTNYYIFNDRQYTIDKRNDEIPFAWINGFGAQAQELIDQIDACSKLAELLQVANNNEARKIAALKQQIKGSFGSFIQVYNEALLMPMVSASNEPVPILDTGKSITPDVFERDGRWWVPNAYMLYSGWGEGDYQYGVMDMLEIEVDACNDYDVLYKLSEKYIADVVRALSYKGMEYYFFYQYNKNPSAVYPVFDWHLYTYYDEANSTKFKYCGQVFGSDYSWPLAYRLNNVFFNPSADGFKTDPQAIMSDYIWFLTHQVLADQDYNSVPNEARPLEYNITLNANGGTLSNYALTGQVHQDVTLPVPEKSGATFGGWYMNNAYEGAALDKIAAKSNRKDITLYAKWLAGSNLQTLSVRPADVFGSDMVVQQNKPFNVFGTGIDGTSVSVTLSGTTKTATVSGGKWSVAFDAMAASWEAKTLTVSGGGVNYTYTGILVGEVWLGSGQSNMQMTLSWMNGTGVQFVGGYGHFDNFNKIRMYRQQIPGMPFSSDENNTNRWVVADCPNEALAQSAYMLSFALNLQKQLGLPVGVIVSAQGATYIEEWLSSESIASAGSVLVGATTDASGNPLDPNAITSRYYYGMTELLRGVKVSGVVWYQGENNAFAYNYPSLYPHAAGVDYAAQLAALHAQYKDIFGDNNIPLIVTELAPYAWDDYEDFRLTQRRFVSSSANAYLLSTVDIGEAQDIHPVYKKELGRRAANIALEFVYEAQWVSDTLSYVPVSATQSGGKITLKFESGKTISANGALIGFKVENAQGVLESVTASVVNNEVVIDYAGTAVNVYYMYVKPTVGQFRTDLYYYIGQPGLYGGNGLPVAPFAIAVQ